MKQLFSRYAGAKTRLVFAFVCSIFAFVATTQATDPKYYAVQVSATVQTSPAQVTLSWPTDSNSQGYTIKRKAPSSTSWTQIGTVSGSTGTYTDSGVSVGGVYEYQLSSPTPWNYTGYGYVQVGINAPLVDSRGKLLLVVDKTYATDLATELTRLQQDLVGDGWTVIRRDVSRTDSVQSVKNVIKTEYNADPNNLKSVFLFGHVPVPYSGNFNPDGHPDHQGAWPADLYYADMDGNWTDSSVNNSGASRAQNKNVPGDGKFDQSDMPSNVELQIGRVDLANMTAIKNVTGQTELDLLRQYLNKNNNFRQRKFNLQRRGLICDNFDESGGEAFASSGWRNFSAFFGANNVTKVGQDQYFPTVGSQDYLWSYGCGGGSYYTCYGVGAIEDFARTDIKSVFTMFLGSYFGDWDAESDFLRGPLASKTYGLASMWAGRPHWFVHAMGVGETLGYCAKLSQNNASGGVYSQQNWGTHQVHAALMGDPTLRMHVVVPPSNVTVNNGTIKWSASTDSDLQGYHVYRATTANGPFTRVTTAPVIGTSYTDSSASSGTYTYMVRAIKLERSGSGTYYNASQGAFANGSTTGGSDQTGGDTTLPSTNTPPSSSTNVVTTPTNNPPVTVTNSTTSASFVKFDSTTQGNWKGVYGTEGYQVMGDQTQYPSYALIMPSGKADWTWQWSTTEARALTRGASTDRIAGCWYSSGTMSADVNLTDGKAHRVSFYCLDWDNNNRVQTIEVVDNATGTTLLTQSVTGFGSGKYAVFDLKGNVKVRFTRNSGYNTVISGMFFDAAGTSTTEPTPTPTPTPVTINAPVISPSGGTFTNSVNVAITATNGATIRYTVDGSTPSSSSALYSSAITLTESATVKAVAFASGTNSSVASVTLTKAVVVAPTTPTNTPPPTVTNTPPTTVTNTTSQFVLVDNTTSGKWKNTYGTQGYNLPGFGTAYPSYAQVTPSGNSSWIWQWSTTDSRAAQKPGAATDGIASCLYSASSFTIDINVTDGKFHRVALYCLDWDKAGRVQTVELLDGTTGAVLNTQSVSGFSNGKYLVYDVKGKVKVRVTKNSGPNAVIDGIFFDASPTL